MVRSTHITEQTLKLHPSGGGLSPLLFEHYDRSSEVDSSSSQLEARLRRIGSPVAHCTQGMLTFSAPLGAGTTFGSETLEEDLPNMNRICRGGQGNATEHFPLPDQSTPFTAPVGEAGDLVLWNEAKPHAASNGRGSGEIPRVAQPVCWLPRSTREPKVIAEKLKRVDAMCGTSHRPDLCRKHGPVYTYFNPTSGPRSWRVPYDRCVTREDVARFA